MAGSGPDREAELERALAPVRDAAVPPPLARAVRDLLLGVEEATAGARLDELDRGLGDLVAAVRAAREQVAALALQRSAAVPFGDAWWARLRAEPDGGAWVRAYAEAVRAGRGDVARLLAEPARAGTSPEPPAELAGPALTGAEHLERGEPEGLADVLVTILDGPWARVLDATERIDLEVLLARLAGSSLDAQDRLRAVAAHRREDEPQLQSRLLAAIGQCALAAGDLEGAESAFAEAIGLDEEEVDGIVGAGMLADRREQWEVAEGYYDRAAELADDAAVLERLHAPVPGNLYWRLSRHLATQPDRVEDALRALDRAIERGMTGAEPYQERRAHVDKAYLLEHLRRPAEAADAFADGALQYLWSEELQTAHGLLERAVDLAPHAPQHRWLLAEALRMLAQRPDGTVDRALIGEALAHWRAGRRWRPPSREEAWVYVTYGLAAYDDVAGTPSERRRLWEAAAAAEDALLLDPATGGGWSLAAMAYLELALPHVALDAAQRAAETYPVDPVAGNYLSQAQLSTGHPEEALATVRVSDEAWADLGAAFVHVALGQPQQALEALGPTEGRAVNDTARLIRALVLAAGGRDDEAAAEVAQWPEPQGPAPASSLHAAGWAAYLRGRLDDADELFSRALADDPGEAAAVLLDRGQVLLARGRGDDLAEGARLTAEGLRRCTRWERFAILESTELPLLLRRVAGTDHAAAVADVVATLRAGAAERLGAIAATGADGDQRGSDEHSGERAAAELRDVLAAAPPDSSEAHAAHAALGRMLLDQHSADEALAHYRAAVAAGSSGAWEGVVTACRRVRDRLDGSPGGPTAGAAYERLAEVLLDVPGDVHTAEAAHSLRAGLVTRAAVCAVLGDEAAAAARLLGALTPDARAEVPTAVAAVVPDGATYWAFVDGLARHRGALGDWAEPLAGATTLDAVLRTRRSDVDLAKVFPLESPVYVHLGPGLVPEDTGADSVLFGRLIPQLRDRVKASSGVTIPGIRFARGALDRTEYEIRLGRRLVRSGRASLEVGSADDAAVLAPVMADLESVLHHCLDRLFGPDDLTLWVHDVDPDGALEHVREVAALLADRAGRVWTHRVLRMLVREGVPIDDGAQLLLLVAQATAESNGDALGAVARVRAARADRVPGVREAVPLPAELERQLAAGLHEGAASVVWQLPRERAAELVRAVRDWQGAERRAVEVSDARVRNYLWRLLAPGGRWTDVVTTQETTSARAAASPGTEGP